MLPDPEMSSRFNRKNHLAEVLQERKVTPNNDNGNVNVLQLLQTLRQNLPSLEVHKPDVSELTTNIKKRKTDPLYDVLEEVYEDYEDNEQAVWTSVGTGRVKIWPLSFGMRKEKICNFNVMTDKNIKIISFIILRTTKKNVPREKEKGSKAPLDAEVNKFREDDKVHQPRDCQ